MPFVKNTSYRDMPFSLESPSPEEFYYFVTVRELQRMQYHRNVYRCRTVGILNCNYGKFFIHEMDDESIQVPLSFAHWVPMPPYAGMPFATQVTGLVYWEDGWGPVLQPNMIQGLLPHMAYHLRSSMIWCNLAHAASTSRSENIKTEK